MSFDLFKAFILGVVEGLTEFLPVSSTGHLLLVQRFFGFDDDDFGKTFAVLIQFGAILALLSIYFFRLWRLALDGSTDLDNRLLVGTVDWPLLARELDLTGAGIKGAALAAAFLARTARSPIETTHLVAAARRELEKQGRVVRTRQEATG